jgi:hypothetical protein
MSHCEPTPYDPRSSPYAGVPSPYVPKTSPFTGITPPFTAITDKYGPGRYCPVLLYPEDGYPVMFDDGVTIRL